MIDAERLTNPASGAAKARERPILFSSEMVKAILDGRKTMTRRAVRPQPQSPGVLTRGDGLWRVLGKGEMTRPFTWEAECPFGQPGDQLWVRETHFRFIEISAKGGANKVLYRADHPEWFCKWRPSIHMPRWASRITLEITAVRIERVQDITEEDAKKEGVLEVYRYGNFDGHLRDCFHALWDSLNAKRGYGWENNPFVWTITFKRIRP